MTYTDPDQTGAGATIPETDRLAGEAGQVVLQADRQSWERLWTFVSAIARFFRALAPPYRRHPV